MSYTKSYKISFKKDGEYISFDHTGGSLSSIKRKIRRMGITERVEIYNRCDDKVIDYQYKPKV